MDSSIHWCYNDPVKGKPTHCPKGHELAVTGKLGNGWCKECYNICPKGHDKRITGWTKSHRCRLCLNARTNKWNRKRYRELRNGIVRPKRNGDERIRDSEKQVTYGQYAKLFAEQDGKCAICRKPEEAVDRATGTTWALSVDHDHTSGEIRGLLCNHCNRGLGLFFDNPQSLHAAWKYLLRTKAKQATPTNESTTPEIPFKYQLLLL